MIRPRTGSFQPPRSPSCTRCLWRAAGRPAAHDAGGGREGQPQRQFLLYHDKKGGENPWRKHHTSAITRDIWIYDTARARTADHDLHRRGSQTPSSPTATSVLLPERGERHVQRPQDERGGGKSQQVTSFTKMPVRFLSLSDTGVLCFGTTATSTR